MSRGACLAVLISCALCLGAAPAEPSRAAQAGHGAMSLDQCADDYLLALAPRSAIVAVSPQAREPDAYMRDAAVGLTQLRPTLESILVAHPAVVVRYWTASSGLVSALSAHGVRTVQLEDAHDFAGIRRNIRRVAAATDRRAQGEAMIAGMDAKLVKARGAWRGRRGLYLTPGGFTAGPGTLVFEILSAAGMADLEAHPGYQPVSLERLALDPPDLVVRGFYDERPGGWELGRRPVLDAITRGATDVYLPARLLGCPAWFSADAVEMLAARTGKGR